MEQQINKPAAPIVLHASPSGLQCWDTEGAVRLRRDHRLLGTLVGGMSQFKNQNAVNSLPLVLGHNEAAIALQQGWATVRPPALEVAAEEQEDAQPSAEGSSGNGMGVSTFVGKRRKTPGWLQDGSDEYFAYYERLGAYGRQAQRQRLQQEQQHTGKSHHSQQQQSPSQAHNIQGHGTHSFHQTGQSEHQPQQSQQQQQHLQQQHLQQGHQQQDHHHHHHHQQQQQQQQCQQCQQQQHSKEEQGYVQQLVARSEAFNRTSQGGCPLRLIPQADATPPELWKSVLTNGDSYFRIPVRAHTSGQQLPTPQELQEQEQQQQQQQQKQGGTGGKKGKKDGSQKDAGVLLQLQAREREEQQRARTQREQQQQQQQQREASALAEEAGRPSLPLGYPANADDDMRLAVFRDLHSQGYALSAGPKFGADLLAYPGDPCLYHAQFTVRIVEPNAAICPTALKASVRGSHAARKHLLLASAVPGMPPSEGAARRDRHSLSTSP